MICADCKTVYRPTADQLGTVESLAGLCDDCGTEPRFKPFGIAFQYAALSGILAPGLAMLAMLVVDWQRALIPVLLVGVVVFAVRVACGYTRPVRYESSAQRSDRTFEMRVAGGVLGFVVGIGTSIGMMNWT